MEFADYASTPFGEPRRTPGRHGYVAYFPASIPRSIEMPAETVKLLGDAEASLGRLAGVGVASQFPGEFARAMLRLRGCYAAITSSASTVVGGVGCSRSWRRSRSI
ncbi:MAG TPA: hypothetical protein VNR42_06230, partial [Solirubrobacteraceae bacterium]|nr:hypothetical protein [Solirubrobacteraceae bacterium]